MENSVNEKVQMNESYLHIPEDHEYPQLKAHGLSEALYKSLWLLSRMPKQPSRYGDTQELTNLRLIIENPQDRTMRLEGRGENIFAQVAETLWVLGGKDELVYLSPFLPRAKEFSDDGGKTWRSAYGKRLRHYPVQGESYKDPRVIPNGFDQLKALVDLFVKSFDTRRGHLVLTYPPVDHSPGIDVVCNVALQFYIRDKKLYMTIHNRSNDSIWGFSGINFFEFTVLQEIIAHLVSVGTGEEIGLGTYVHNSTSFHVYSHHSDRMDTILSENSSMKSHDPSKVYPWKVPSIEKMDNALEVYFLILKDIQSGTIQLYDEGLDNALAELHESCYGTSLAPLCSACLIYAADKKEPMSSDKKNYLFSKFVDIGKYKETYIIEKMRNKFIEEASVK